MRSDNSLTFNPPPNWPPLPTGLEPDPTWRPDPSLPPAPPGWPLWVLGRERPGSPILSRVLGALGVLIVTALLVFFLTSEGRVPRPSAEGPGTPCALLMPIRATTDNTALIVTMRMTSLCSGGALLAHKTRITITSSGQDVAAGTFDLSTTPISVPAPVLGHESSVIRDFRFPIGMFWRTPDSLPALDANATTSSPLDVRYDPGGGDRPGTVAPPVASTAPLEAIGPAPPRGGDVQAATLVGLNAIADSDRQAVESGARDQWVPQLSIKWRNQEWEGVTYADPEILVDHLKLRLSHENVRLVRSNEWKTLSANPDSWVTLEGKPFPDSALANAWCDANGFTAPNCFARLLSNADPPPNPDHSYR
jgi:hypothetical protein